MVYILGLRPGDYPGALQGNRLPIMLFLDRSRNQADLYCPDLNYGAAVHADKWIPILPNTDAALQLAIIYTWIKEESYDKGYVSTHAVGFDKVMAYVMGEEDGVAKTPAWAAQKCGVPEWTIKALARDWAKKIVSIAHYFGGSYIRGPYSSEPAGWNVFF